MVATLRKSWAMELCRHSPSAKTLGGSKCHFHQVVALVPLTAASLRTCIHHLMLYLEQLDNIWSRCPRVAMPSIHITQTDSTRVGGTTIG